MNSGVFLTSADDGTVPRMGLQVQVAARQFQAKYYKSRSRNRKKIAPLLGRFTLGANASPPFPHRTIGG
jgi:hypothetical protein